MHILTDPLHQLESYQKLLDCTKKKATPVMAAGVIDAQQAHLAYALSEDLNRPLLFVTHNEKRAKNLIADLAFYFKNDILFYPSKDIIFYSADVHSADIIKQRFNCIDKILNKDFKAVVLSCEALMDRLVEKKILQSFILDLWEGAAFDIQMLAERLVAMGYERAAMVEGTGQFAIRGGILDIAAPVYENALRIEFWGDEIDSIRFMDPLTQRSIERLSSIQLYPVRELVYDQDTLVQAIKKIQKDVTATIIKYTASGKETCAKALEETISEALEKLSQHFSFPGTSNFIHYFYQNTVSLFDYLPENCLIFWDEPSRIASRFETSFTEFQESILNRIEKGAMLPKQAELVFEYHDLLKQSSLFDQILFSSISQRSHGFTCKEMIPFQVKSFPYFQNKLDLLLEELTYLKQENYTVLILGGPKSRCLRLQNELAERGFTAQSVSDLSQGGSLEPGIYIAAGSISAGFSYEWIRFCILSDRELFGESKKPGKRRKNKGKPIESFTDLKPGDYVVHENHGVGVYKGIEQIQVEELKKDYLRIAYADDGVLFVPTTQLDMLQKFIGSEASHVKLHKLGGQEWNRTKSRAKKAVSILAEDLIVLYAKRMESSGFVFSKDTVWQKEFEETFPFEETDDQLAAIEDVKKDMEQNKVMDRLICGDVGYGKTEIAIRAAFKAVSDGKQVAFLVPTTILAQQHYNTFTQRMQNFPIRIDMLSRFRTPGQQKETLRDLEKGFVDILIGTHRILSKDVRFKNLGLVVVDEEQRFGVSHKEKLKILSEGVDVLTLTATPIPRTLHMSLTGIRDMSILEEPPHERHPVQTYVMEYNAEFLRDAINRELGRGGQVYYLHNRVRNISDIAFKIQNLVPDATVSYAHGQMSERELEQIMMDFIDGSIDVLVCTTIIETGLDISNVNTIIINDADRMGLAQLYQLRGRVGRSNKIAYAYFMYQKDKVLQEVAEKRLQTIREFTEFGSGFKIAMRDLEIRGAGDLLGADQHGHMEAVGYDMYCKLLQEAIAGLKGELVETPFETTVEINVDAYIPASFIPDEEQKLEIYKKISLITGEDSYLDMQEEIIDRFGDMPKCVQNLLEIALIKAYAHQAHIISMGHKGSNFIFTFKEDATVSPEKLSKVIEENKGCLFFTNGMNPYLTYKEKNENQALTNIKILLQGLIG